MYSIQLTNQAIKDASLIKNAGLKNKVASLIEVVATNPFQNPPFYEKLTGDRRGAYSRRISRQHRFVYEVIPNTNNLKDENDILYDGIVKIIRM